MAEETILRDYIGSIVKESVAEALAVEVPKYLKQPEKRYYTIEEVCKLLDIKRSTYFNRAKRGDFVIEKRGHATLIDAEDFDDKVEKKILCKYVRTRKSV